MINSAITPSLRSNGNLLKPDWDIHALEMAVPAPKNAAGKKLKNGKYIEKKPRRHKHLY